MPLVDETAMVEALGGDLERWARKCHAASLHLVKSGILPATARVARGTHSAVGGQHSWIVPDGDCYDPHARVIDPTLWSYDLTVTGIWIGRRLDPDHVPHGGHGDIWSWGKPVRGRGEIIELTPRKPLSSAARMFLDMLGPLDLSGWMVLAGAPVAGWPAAEIIDAIYSTERLTAAPPIDIVGMLTDHNPGGLYLPEMTA